MSEELKYQEGGNPLEKIENIESGEQTYTLVFNKISGAYYATVATDSAGDLNGVNFKFKTVTYDKNTHEWIGDYDTGSLVPIDDVPTVVFEEDIDRQAGQVIGQSYPWFSQINIIIDVVNKLVEESGITGDEVDTFTDMVTFLEARRDANRKYKEAYKADNSFGYKTRRDVWNENAKQLEGGLHEQMPGGATLPHMNPSNDVDQPGQHY
jgi:hypothetical protein